MSDSSDEGGLNMPDNLKGAKTETDDEATYENPLDFLGERNLFPTEIETLNPEFASMTLNDELEIKNISLPSDRTPYVEWPRSTRDQEEGKNTIWFEEMTVKNALSECVSNQLTTSDAPIDLEVSVDRFHEYEQDSLLGFLDVNVNDVMTIKGAKLMVTEGERWISWPAEQGEDGDWQDLFYSPDPLDARLIEQIEEKQS